jgi:hypothetical protein
MSLGDREGKMEALKTITLKKLCELLTQECVDQLREQAAKSMDLKCWYTISESEPSSAFRYQKTGEGVLYPATLDPTCSCEYMYFLHTGAGLPLYATNNIDTLNEYLQSMKRDDDVWWTTGLWERKISVADFVNHTGNVSVCKILVTRDEEHNRQIVQNFDQYEYFDSWYGIADWEEFYSETRSSALKQ